MQEAENKFFKLVDTIIDDLYQAKAETMNLRDALDRELETNVNLKKEIDALRRALNAKHLEN